MFKRTLLTSGFLALAFACYGAAAAQDVPVVQPSGGDIEARLARVERLVQSQGLLDLLSQVQDLQRQIKQLRGSIEEQGHRLQLLTAKQGQLYVDIDRRLQALEHGGVAANDGAGAPGVVNNPPIQVLNANDGPAPAGKVPVNQPPRHFCGSP